MKYLALAGWLILLMACVVGIREANRDVLQPQLNEPTAAIATMVDAASIAQAIRGARMLDAQLETVAAVAFAPRGDAPLLAYAPPSPASAGVAAAASQADGAARHSRVVTLLYSGEGFKRAVIDGKYLRVGDHLAGGARVTGIFDTGVRIRDAQGSQLLRVPEARRVFGPEMQGMSR